MHNAKNKRKIISFKKNNISKNYINDKNNINEKKNWSEYINYQAFKVFEKENFI